MFGQTSKANKKKFVEDFLREEIKKKDLSFGEYEPEKTIPAPAAEPIVEQIVIPKVETEVKPIPEKEYVLVEGYKATDSNMTCKELQYNMGEIYTFDGDPQVCKTGFHFCLNLTDVFKYYDFNFNNRYFKVLALVEKNSYESYGKTVKNSPQRIEFMKARGYTNYPTFERPLDKLTAKEIFFLEEVTYTEVYESSKTSILNSNWIENFEEYQEAMKIGSALFIRNKFIRLMSTYRTELFSSILFDDHCMKNITRHTQPNYSGNVVISNDAETVRVASIKECKRLVQLAQMYYEEGLSKDMQIYMLLNKN